MAQITQKTKLVLLVTVIVVLIISIIVAALFLINKKVTTKSSAESGTTVNLSFSPATLATQSNQSYTVNIQAQPLVDMSYQGYYYRINFDNTKLKVTDLTYLNGVSASLGLGDSNTTDQNTLPQVNQNGYITFYGQVSSSSLPVLPASTPTSIDTITFTALDSTPSAISLNPTYTSAFTQLLSDGLTLTPANIVLANPLQINPPTVTTATTTSPVATTTTTAITTTATTPSPTATTTTAITTTAATTTTTTTTVIAATTSATVTASTTATTSTTAQATTSATLAGTSTTPTSTTTPPSKLPNTGVFEDTLITGIIGIGLIAVGSVIYSVNARKRIR